MQPKQPIMIVKQCKHADIFAKQLFGHSHALLFASNRCYMLLLSWLLFVFVISDYNMHLSCLHTLLQHAGVVQMPQNF